MIKFRDGNLGHRIIDVDQKAGNFHQIRWPCSVGKVQGNIAEALAAYNWGKGNLDKLLKSHPTDWMRRLPVETEKYVTGAIGIIVTDATGATQSGPSTRPRGIEAVTFRTCSAPIEAYLLAALSGRDNPVIFICRTAATTLPLAAELADAPSP